MSSRRSSRGLKSRLSTNPKLPEDEENASEAVTAAIDKAERNMSEDSAMGPSIAAAVKPGAVASRSDPAADKLAAEKKYASGAGAVTGASDKAERNMSEDSAMGPSIAAAVKPGAVVGRSDPAADKLTAERNRASGAELSLPHNMSEKSVDSATGPSIAATVKPGAVVARSDPAAGKLAAERIQSSGTGAGTAARDMAVRNMSETSVDSAHGPAIAAAVKPGAVASRSEDPAMAKVAAAVNSAPGAMAAVGSTPGAVADSKAAPLDPTAAKAAASGHLLAYAARSGSPTEIPPDIASGPAGTKAADDPKPPESKLSAASAASAAIPAAAAGAYAVAGIDGSSASLIDASAESIIDSVDSQRSSKPFSLASTSSNPILEAELVDSQRDLDAQVQNEVERILGDSEIAHAEPAPKSRKKMWIMMAILAILIVGGVVGAVVATTGGDNPAPAPTSAPILPEVEPFYNLLEPISGDSIDVPGSPQNDALNWIALNDTAGLEVGTAPNDVIIARYAAAVIYYSLLGEAWQSQLNFLTEGSICTWNENGKGIICVTGSENPTQLMLSQNGLAGSIPQEISELSDLEIINVLSGNIIGTIPDSIAKLSNLEKITLDSNSIRGTIPSDIFRLNSLQEFHAVNNDLTGTIPPGIGEARSLVYFAANNNTLNGTLPSSIGQSTSLANVEVHSNAITGRIPEFTSSSPLFGILAFSNRLVGSIPASFGALTNLAVVAFGDNDLTGPLPDFSQNRDALQVFEVNLNRLSGNVSNFFETAPPNNVGVVLLNGNMFGGNIPTRIGLFTALTNLEMQGNKNIEGTIPSEVGRLTNLNRFLRLDDNKLTGSIPSELGQLSSMIVFTAGVNQLSGPLPLELANWRSMLVVDLRMNNLSGNVSSVLNNMSRGLQQLDLDSNKFTGTLPTSLGEFRQLNFADFAVNGLVGTLPTEVGLMTAATSLSFQRNDLVGMLPSELGLLTALTFLDLSNNMFMGTVPTQLASLTSLDRLFLNNNDLSGNVDAICSANIDFTVFATETCGDPSIDDVECSCCNQCCVANSFDCRELNQRNLRGK